MAGTICGATIYRPHVWAVSMESGLDGRNNCLHILGFSGQESVSMESGLDGRNNTARPTSSPMRHGASQWSPA